MSDMRKGDTHLYNCRQLLLCFHLVDFHCMGAENAERSKLLICFIVANEWDNLHEGEGNLNCFMTSSMTQYANSSALTGFLFSPRHLKASNNRRYDSQARMEIITIVVQEKKRKEETNFHNEHYTTPAFISIFCTEVAGALKVLLLICS